MAKVSANVVKTVSFTIQVTDVELEMLQRALDAAVHFWDTYNANYVTPRSRTAYVYLSEDLRA